MEDHRRSRVDPRDAVVELVPKPPEQIEAMLDAVGPVSEEGGQHDRRECRPKAPAAEVDDGEVRQERQDQDRQQAIENESDDERRDADQPPVADVWHEAAGRRQHLNAHESQKDDRQ